MIVHVLLYAVLWFISAVLVHLGDMLFRKFIARNKPPHVRWMIETAIIRPLPFVILTTLIATIAYLSLVE